VSDIWKTIAELGFEVHPDRIGTVAAKIASLSSRSDFERVRSSFGPGIDRSLIDRLAVAWEDMPNLTPLELAAALRGASATASLIEKRETVEMVWTGPSTGLVASRHTEQVFLEVITSARRRLFLVCFVAHDIETVMTALQDAIGRNVEVDVLLESSKDHGGKIDIDSIDTFRNRLPSANIYAWGAESKSSGKWTGAVHAKCAVADRALAFITSANLTSAAMERNMELGVLIRGGPLPVKLDKHLRALAETEIIERVA